MDREAQTPCVGMGNNIGPFQAKFGHPSSPFSSKHISSEGPAIMTRQFKTQETNCKSTEAPPYDGNPLVEALGPMESGKTQVVRRIGHMQYVPRRQTDLLAILHALTLDSCQQKSRARIVTAVSGSGKTRFGGRENQ